MSKKKLGDLETENARLLSKVKELQDELDALNENTIVTSMNDMRDRYNELVSSCVCLHRHQNLKMYYKRSFGMCKTIENISSLLFDKVMQLIIFMDQYTPERPNFSHDIQQIRIKNDMTSIKDRIQLILELFDREDELEIDACDVDYCEFRGTT
ncbi:MAG: hypothetical protein EBU90_01950 [Proteobacteria bacterium]|nr:hypothetical protein [Pseudomonadota bacterium]NBP13244.1 hypothetical protein [bacterium]